jgi:signal transduction histidine kinase
MIFLRTLRTRIVVGFVVFGLFLSITLALGVYAGFHKIEDVVIRDAMRAELAQLQAGSTEQAAPISVMHIYSVPGPAAQSPPASLRELPPGFHRRSLDGHRYTVLVEDRGERRYIVTYDEAQILRRQRYGVLGLMVSVVLALLVSAWAGYSLAGQVIRPVRQLTTEVKELESGRAQGTELQGYANDEIGALATAFRNYRDRFRALMEREREFASNVSHELRTPVTSINLAAEVLEQDPSMSERQRYRLSRIRRAGQEMSEMINTFLLLSRHEDEGDVDFSDCDVNRIVRETIDNQSVWVGDKPVSTRVIEDDQLTVRAPQGVIAVLVGNVVRNAYRYTQQGSVTVRITADRVIVEDTGPGIDPETREHLFDRHVRGAPSSDQGSGLGLAIVKRLCERYGWHVEVRSTPGEGSRFDIVMHRNQDSASAAKY